MLFEGSKSALLCGTTIDEVVSMDSCVSVNPNSESDCNKMTKGDVQCRFAAMDKSGEKVKMCIAIKGDTEMMMNLGIEPRLRGVTFNSVSNSTGFDRYKVSFCLISILILFGIFI